MADENKIKEYQAKVDAAEAKAKAAEEKSKADAAELKKFKEQQATDQQAAQVKAFKDECEGMVKDGLLMPTEREKLVKEIQYTEDGVLVPFASLKKFAENRKLLDTKEYGEDGKPIHKEKTYTGASDELADRAKKYSVENKVEYEVAAAAILEEDPDLAERYKMDDA